MKKLSFVLFAISLLVPASALGQDTSKPDTTTPNNLKSQRASTKPLKLSGKVGENAHHRQKLSLDSDQSRHLEGPCR